MKKIVLLLAICAVLVTGCGKKEAPEPASSPVPPPTVEPSPSPSVADQQKEEPTLKPKDTSNDSKPTMKDLEDKINKLNETTDEVQREELLAEIDKILKQAEEKSMNQ